MGSYMKFIIMLGFISLAVGQKSKIGISGSYLTNNDYYYERFISGGITLQKEHSYFDWGISLNYNEYISNHSGRIYGNRSVDVLLEFMFVFKPKLNLTYLFFGLELGVGRNFYIAPTINKSINHTFSFEVGYIFVYRYIESLSESGPPGYNALRLTVFYHLNKR